MARSAQIAMSCCGFLCCGMALLSGPALAADPSLAAGRGLADRPGVHLSGDARMGVIWSDQRMTDTNSARLQFTSRARLRFGLVGETDGGTQFGVNFETDAPLRRAPGGN